MPISKASRLIEARVERLTIPGSDSKLYTYTIITTSSNKQLSFLHDRMPVILNNGSDEMFQWLDSSKTEWNKKLQSLLRPYEGELECYPVSKDVGKVGNNSSNFVVPLDSSANKHNIANFFGTQRKAPDTNHSKPPAKLEGRSKDNSDNVIASEPVAGTKREHSYMSAIHLDNDEHSRKAQKTAKDKRQPSAKPQSSPKKMKNATSNGTPPKASPVKAADGSKKITGFLKG